MRDRDVDNYMMMPRSRENRKPARYCNCCDNGIWELEKYYEVPVGSKWETWCEECTEDHTAYAKYDTECIKCGAEIKEDEDCFVTDDGQCVCLDCLEEMSKINSD